MCDYCRQYPCVSRCPHFKNQESFVSCSGCGDGIYYNEEYILIGNSYYHKECAFELTAREVLKGFGIKGER